jgi:hypothetical protein
MSRRKTNAVKIRNSHKNFFPVTKLSKISVALLVYNLRISVTNIFIMYHFAVFLKGR